MTGNIDCTTYFEFLSNGFIRTLRIIIPFFRYVQVKLEIGFEGDQEQMREVKRVNKEKYYSEESSSIARIVTKQKIEKATIIKQGIINGKTEK